jgi:hypothetical protein
MKTVRDQPKSTIQLESAPVTSYIDWDGTFCLLSDNGDVYSQIDTSSNVTKGSLLNDSSKITAFLLIEKNHYILGFANGRIICLRNQEISEINKEAKPIISLLLVQNQIWTCTSTMIKIYARNPIECIKIIQCNSMDRSYLVELNVWTFCDDGTITIRDMNGTITKEIKGDAKPLSLAVMGTKVVVGFNNSSIKFFDSMTGTVSKYRKVGVQPESIVIGFDCIWICSYRGMVVYDLASFQQILDLGSKNWGFCWLASNQGEIWVVCTDKKIRIWGKESNAPSPTSKILPRRDSVEKKEKQCCDASTQTEEDPLMEIETLRLALENTTKFKMRISQQPSKMDLKLLRDQILEAKVERTHLLTSIQHKDFLLAHILPKNNETMQSVILSLANELIFFKNKKSK